MICQAFAHHACYDVFDYYLTTRAALSPSSHTNIKKAQTSVAYLVTEALALPIESNKQQEAYADMTHYYMVKKHKGAQYGCIAPVV